MDSTSNARRPCFIEEDDGLASLADMEAGISGTGNHYHNHNHNHPFFSRTLCYSSSYNISGRGSFRNLSISSPRSGIGRFYDARFEEHQPHFLEACSLCKKPLGDNKDIFMYRLAISSSSLGIKVLHFLFVVLFGKFWSWCLYLDKKEPTFGTLRN